MSATDDTRAGPGKRSGPPGGMGQLPTKGATDAASPIDSTEARRLSLELEDRKWMLGLLSDEHRDIYNSLSAVERERVRLSASILVWVESGAAVCSAKARPIFTALIERTMARSPR
jgi:hypothetical protein